MHFWGMPLYVQNLQFSFEIFLLCRDYTGDEPQITLQFSFEIFVFAVVVVCVMVFTTVWNLQFSFEIFIHMASGVGVEGLVKPSILF